MSPGLWAPGSALAMPDRLVPDPAPPVAAQAEVQVQERPAVGQSGKPGIRVAEEAGAVDHTWVPGACPVPEAARGAKPFVAPAARTVLAAVVAQKRRPTGK
ncbi:hypothetical protein MSIMFB_02389 [Mycobacterium simulans]|uniref:Uncharacterized protein n=1 Tax=Mycobacterium simulans TaxID=627089 RepID=A0A7Z7ILI6_9MYCO|nr:hypothetical protein MSIMFB_02389 [Mycobacterium simulans]